MPKHSDNRRDRYLFPLPTSRVPQPEQQRLASVTTVINAKAKPWLAPWSSRTVAVAAADHLQATLTEIGSQLDSGVAYGDVIEGMTSAELIPQYRNAGFDGNEPYLAIRDAAQNYTNYRGRVGSAVHDLIYRAFVEGVQTTDHEAYQLLNERVDPWKKPVAEFFEDYVDEVLFAEKKMYNTEHLYAGTPDLIARMKQFGDRPAGQIAVIDWKTGRKVDQDVALQLNAYAMCDGIKGDPTGTVQVDGDTVQVYDDGLVPVPQIDYGLTMHLRGNYTLDAYTVDVSDRWSDYFLNLLAIYRANLAANRRNADDRWYEALHQITTKEAEETE